MARKNAPAPIATPVFILSVDVDDDDDKASSMAMVDCCFEVSPVFMSDDASSTVNPSSLSRETVSFLFVVSLSGSGDSLLPMVIDSEHRHIYSRGCERCQGVATQNNKTKNNNETVVVSFIVSYGQSYYTRC